MFYETWCGEIFIYWVRNTSEVFKDEEKSWIVLAFFLCCTL